MSEHDPINELSRFGADLSTRAGGDMPLTAVDVRRRGDQIRRRRNALVAGGSALAVAAVAVPIFAVVGMGTKSVEPGPAQDPTQGIGRGVLLTDDDTVYSEGADWFRTDVGDGDGQAGFNPCAQDGLTGTGATSVVHADFELRNTLDPDVTVSGDFMTQVVGEYADAAAAEAAYEQVSDWVEGCEQRPADITEYRHVASRDVPVDGATAQILDSQYGPVPEELDPYGEAAHIMETGVLRKGNVLVVITSVIVGQDYDFLDEEGGTPVNRMLPAAAARLG